MLLCQLCPRWRGATELRHRLHLRSHFRARCGLCGRIFAHSHIRLLHRLLGRCSGTLRARSEAVRATLLRDRIDQASQSLTEVIEEGEGRSTESQLPKQASKPQKARTHACPKCERAVTSAKQLQRHLKWSQSCGWSVPAKDRACPKCGKRGSAAWLREHSAASSSCGELLERYRCDSCQVPFAYKDHLALHVSSCRAAPRSGLRCPRCEKPFAKPSALKLHVKSPVACAHRLQAYKSHDADFQCPKCSKRLKTKFSLGQHLAVSASFGEYRGRFPCPKCGRAFASAYRLASHQARGFCEEFMRIRKRQSLAQADNTCAKCGKSFRRRETLKNHLVISRSCGDQKSKLKCDGCHMSFSLPFRLRSHASRGGCSLAKKLALHKALAGSPAVKGLFRCADCDFTAKAAGLMSQHRQNNNGCRLRRLRARNRSLVAAVEGTNGEDSETLQPHTDQSDSVNVERRTCKKCQRTLRSFAGLYTHLRKSKTCSTKPAEADTMKYPASKAAITAVTGSGSTSGSDAPKKLECPKCGKVLGSAGTLRQHVRQSKSCGFEPRKSMREIRAALPPSDKVYPCPKCGKVQRDAKSLKYHLRSTRTCGFLAASCICDRCGMAFCKPSQAAQHIYSRIACDRELKRRQTLERVGIQDSSKSLQNLGKEKRHWSCPKCGRAFVNIFLLRQHVDRVRGDTCGDAQGNVACDDCGHATSRPHLAKHFFSLKSMCKMRP